MCTAPAASFPVTHSTPSSTALLHQVLPEYAIPDPVDCRLLHRGLNDTYIVNVRDGGHYILRVYHHAWRTIRVGAGEFRTFRQCRPQVSHVARLVHVPGGPFGAECSLSLA